MTLQVESPELEDIFLHMTEKKDDLDTLEKRS